MLNGKFVKFWFRKTSFNSSPNMSLPVVFRVYLRIRKMGFLLLRRLLSFLFGMDTSFRRLGRLPGRRPPGAAPPHPHGDPHLHPHPPPCQDDAAVAAPTSTAEV